MPTRRSTASRLLVVLAVLAVALGVTVWLVLDDRLLAALVASDVLVLGLLALLLSRLAAQERATRTVEGVLAGLTEQGDGVEVAVRRAVDAALAPDRATAEKDTADRRLAAIQAEAQSQADVWSSLNLLKLLDVREEVPPPGGFAATPTTLLALVAQVLRHDGDGPLVVECGSGTSTVWLALALRHKGSGRVIALEHDEHYATMTREALERTGVAAWAEVRVAPLVDLPAADVEAAGATITTEDGTAEVLRWYDPAAVADLKEVDLLFVDGPPGHTGRAATMGARYPSFAVMAPRLREGATVVLDDVARADEGATTERWTSHPTAGMTLEVCRDTDRARFFRAVRTVRTAPELTSEV